MSKVDIGSEGPAPATVRLEDVAELKTVKVGDNGQVYLGKDYAGEHVLLAFRVQDEDQETDDTDSEDTEN